MLPMQTTALPQAVTLTECLLRDGLQSLERVLTTREKQALLSRIAAAGFRRIEVTSFVPPKYYPQFYDADAMLAYARETTNAELIAFVPNAKGMERAAETAKAGYGPDLALMVVSASEAHNRGNLKRSREETMAEHARAAEIAAAAGIEIIGSISTSFGCPYTGDVPVDEVCRLVAHYDNIGAREVQFGDTTGMANPVQVQRFFEAVGPELNGMAPVAHFHDSRGLAMTNSLVATAMGVTTVDTALGGLGGRPPEQRVQAGGPTGNTSSEDLAAAAAEMGVQTGLDVDRVIAAGCQLQTLLGRDLYSHTPFAGRVRHAPQVAPARTAPREGRNAGPLLVANG